MAQGRNSEAGRGSAGRRAVFLDRDGTLIVDAGYPRDPERVSLLPGAVEALDTFRRHGLLLVVISNQSGVGRGMVTSDQALSVHDRFIEVLNAAGITLDACYYCPHAPEDRCTCRKPSPELIHRAATDHDIDIRGSFMIGDKLIDVETGIRAGCKTVLLDWDGTKLELDPKADLTARDWNQAAAFVVSQLLTRQ